MSASKQANCRHCQAPMSAGTTVGEWVCPDGHRSFTDEPTARMAIKLGLGEIYTSGATINGLPEHQDEGGYTADGVSGFTTVERRAANTNITQTAIGLHYPNKTTQESETGEIFINEYNLVNDRTFSKPEAAVEDRLYDLTASDPRTGGNLLIQVRCADSRPWKVLRTGRYDRPEDEQESFAELWRGIDEKKNHYCSMVGLHLYRAAW